MGEILRINICLCEILSLSLQYIYSNKHIVKILTFAFNYKHFKNYFTMTKQILMPKGNLMRLQQHMKVSQPTLIRALHFRTDTKLADRIREAAIEHFDGVLLDKTNV